MLFDAPLISLAFAVGILVGLTGVGAGALMTPLLIGVFGISTPVAIATDLLFATVTKIVGVMAHGRAGQVDWKLAGKLWAGSLPAVTVGSLLLVGFVASGYTAWITWLLVAFVILTSYTLIRRGLGRDTSPGATPPRSAPPWLAPLGGAGVGLGVSLTSVGAGVLGMALLVRLSPPDTAPRRLVATDLVHAVPIALIAGISYTVSGLVNWELLATLLIGSLPGVIIGALVSQWVPIRWMNLGLGVILGLLALSLIAS